MRYLLLLLPCVCWAGSTAAQLPDVRTIDQNTTGACSPAIVDARGKVEINCVFGIDPKALARLNELLDQKDLEIDAKKREAEQWARRYGELKAQQAALGDTSERIRQSKKALEDGDLEVAGKALFAEFYNRGNAHRKEKNYQESITDYEQALKALSVAKRPDHFGVHYNLADSYAKVGNLGKAIEHFLKATEITPSNTDAIYNLARLHLRKGERDIAKNYFCQVIE
jgi:tetratricopeptide (TPR) repeat protein